MTLPVGWTANPLGGANAGSATRTYEKSNAKAFRGSYSLKTQLALAVAGNADYNVHAETPCGPNSAVKPGVAHTFGIWVACTANSGGHGNYHAELDFYDATLTRIGSPVSIVPVGTTAVQDWTHFQQTVTVPSAARFFGFHVYTQIVNGAGQTGDITVYWDTFQALTGATFTLAPRTGVKRFCVYENGTDMPSLVQDYDTILWAAQTESFAARYYNPSEQTGHYISALKSTDSDEYPPDYDQYGGVTAVRASNPSWLMKDASGAEIHASNLSFPNERGIRFNDSGPRAFFITRMLDRLANGRYTGAMLDNVGESPLYDLAVRPAQTSVGVSGGSGAVACTDAEYQAYYLAFLTWLYPQMVSAGYKLWLNVGGLPPNAAPYSSWMDYCDGVFAEVCFMNGGTYVGESAWVATLAACDWLTNTKGKTAFVQAYQEPDTDAKVRNNLASYYMLANSLTQFTMKQTPGYAPYPSVHRYLKVDLGAPSGAAFVNADSNYQRNHALGKAYFNSSDSVTRSQTLPAGARDLDGTLLTSPYSMGPHTGLVTKP